MFHYIDRPPSGVVVNDIETHSVQVSWEAVENANSYNVRLTQTMGDNQLGLCSESHTVTVSSLYQSKPLVSVLLLGKLIMRC